MKLFDLELDDFRDMPVWYVCVDPRYSGADQYALTALAKGLNVQARAQGYNLFCGMFDYDSGHELFAIFDIHPCDLITELRVGSQNNDESVVAEVYSQLLRIYGNVRRFRPYFVDQAGFHCIFEGKVTEAEAQRIEMVLTHGLEWYWSRWDGIGSAVATAVARENELHLWWD